MPYINDENFAKIKSMMSKKPAAKNSTTVDEPVYDGKYLIVGTDVYEMSNADALIFENLQVINTRKRGENGEATIYTPTRQMQDCCTLAQKQIKAAKAVAKAETAATKVTNKNSKKKS